MNSNICAVLLFLNLFGTIRCEDLLLVDELRLDFLYLEARLWKFVLWEAPTFDRQHAELHLIKRFYEFDQKLKQMPDDILRGMEPVKQIKTFLFLYSELKATENLYEKFRKFQEDHQANNEISYNNKGRINDKIQLEDMVIDILNRRNGANATVNNIYNLMFGNENMVTEIVELTVHDFKCKNFFQSAQQVFYNVYNAIALNGLKNFIMLQFAYLASRISEKGNYTELSNLVKVNYEHRVNETMSVFKAAMELSPQTLWRCDPKTHVQGKNYEEITRLIQGHIQNEVDMNADGTCTEDCALYSISTNYDCYDSDSPYCKEMEKCTGKIRNCKFVESGMNICVSKNASRRYDYVEYDSGKTMGRKRKCGKKTVSGWRRWFVHCSYCMCLCDEPGPKSDRYINMRPIMADTKNNRVVTGLRFVKHNRIIHLQIQEGKLLPYGYIDNDTVHWVPVDDYKITDPGVISGRDYFTLSYENRSLALDEVWVNPSMINSIVTGASFIFDGMLRFQLLTRPMDWKNGSVSQTTNSTIYISSGGKNEIDLSNADVPIYAKRTETNYDNDIYVKFTHTDFGKDAAQTTIPFFDTRPVFNNPPVPLTAAGLQYRGTKGYGGFIAPMIGTYRYCNLIKPLSLGDAENISEENTEYPVLS